MVKQTKMKEQNNSQSGDKSAVKKSRLNTDGVMGAQHVQSVPSRGQGPGLSALPPPTSINPAHPSPHRPAWIVCPVLHRRLRVFISLVVERQRATLHVNSSMSLRRRLAIVACVDSQCAITDKSVLGTEPH